MGTKQQRRVVAAARGHQMNGDAAIEQGGFVRCAAAVKPKLAEAELASAGRAESGLTEGPGAGRFTSSKRPCWLAGHGQGYGPGTDIRILFQAHTQRVQQCRTAAGATQ